MTTAHSITLKGDHLLKVKKWLNLALNVLISLMGISALYIKFFIYDGIIAFRAFTNDGNLFTTVISVISVYWNIRELIDGRENNSRRMFYMRLASAVTEAVIFIINLMGYLPIFPDNPSIWPYHMFCLHVGIPVLAVLRFVFFEKPLGILSPANLLRGTIPIGVYAVGATLAIKLRILPASLIPYSFLDFESNFLWYVVLALIVIPSFGFLWSWMFYRLNLRCSLLWYLEEDVERLQKARVKALSEFDAINSGILLIYCGLAFVILMFSLLGMSKSSTKVQRELLSYISFFMLDDASNSVNHGKWQMKDGVLYKGNLLIGDGTEGNGNLDLFIDSDRFKKDTVDFEVTIYVQASDLDPKVAANYDGMDYVSVCHSTGELCPITPCGETLDRNVLATILTSDSHSIYEEVKVGKVSYYHYCQPFGSSLWNSGVGIIELYFPSSQLTAQVKDAEYGNDVTMIAVIVTAFALLYVITFKWIRVLEKSIEFLKQIASGRIPEEPIKLGKTILFSGLERQLNVLREINKE